MQPDCDYVVHDRPGGWHIQRIHHDDRSQRDRQPSGNRVECHDFGRSRFDHFVCRPLRIGSFGGELLYLSGKYRCGGRDTTGGGNWLSFAPKGHSIIAFPDAIQVSAQPGQAAGTYTGTVVISGSTFPLDNKTVHVTLVVSTSPVIDTTAVSTVQIQGFQGGGKFSSSPSFNVVIPTTGIFSNGSSPISPLAITGATASGAFLSAAVYNSNTISITADAGSLSPGIYRGTVTIASNAANNAAVSVPVAFIVYLAGPSLIFSGGIVNPTTYASEPFAPGEIVALFGLQLAAPGTSAVNPGLPPLATTLGSVQVLVNGVAAPLFYVGPGQINFQIPYSLVSGQIATVQVVSGSTPGNSRSLAITATSPRILLFPGNYAIAFNTDGSIPLPSSQVIPSFVSHPAKPGDVLVIYGVGFGQTSPVGSRRHCGHNHASAESSHYHRGFRRTRHPRRHHNRGLFRTYADCRRAVSDQRDRSGEHSTFEFGCRHRDCRKCHLEYVLHCYFR